MFIFFKYLNVNLTPNFIRPPAQSTVRLARFTSFAAKNSATNFSLNESNLVRITEKFRITRGDIWKKV